jgi:uncharacterized membrane protein
MDMKRIVIGTLVGAVTLHIVGYLMFDLATVDFYAANDAAAANFSRDVNLQWSIGLGNLALAALLTLCIANQASAATIAGGLITGAVIGFLVWFGVDFTFYGYQNRWNLTLTIVDPLLAAVQFGIGGAVIAAVLARVPKGAEIQRAG